MFHNKICSFSPLSEKNCKSYIIYYDGIIPESGFKSKKKHGDLGVSNYITRVYVVIKSDIIFAFRILIRLIFNLYFSEMVPAIRLFPRYG